MSKENKDKNEFPEWNVLDGKENSTTSEKDTPVEEKEKISSVELEKSEVAEIPSATEDVKPEKSKEFLKNIGTTGFALLMALIVAFAAIPINLIAGRLDVEWDMTDNDLYSGDLSDVSREIIENANQNIEIYFLLDRAEMDEDYEIGRVLNNVLDKYDEYDNITVISGDPEENPELFSEFAEKYETLNPGDIIVKGENGLSKQVLATNLFITEPLTSNAESENPEDFSYTFVGENYITGALKYVTDGKEPYIYFIKGHDEKTIDKDYTVLTEMFQSYGYGVSDINLTTTPEIPDNAEVLVIAAPKTDITDDEFEIISSYLDEGGKMAFLLSPNGDEIDYTNIDALLYDYSIGIDYDRVYETDENMYFTDKYTIAAYLNDENDENLTWVTEARALIEQGYHIVMPESRSFYSYDDVVNNNSALTAQPIIFASPTARAENYGGVNKIGNFTDGEILYLAAYAHDAARNDSKIIVWGNAEFADDEMYEQGYTITPLSAFISSVAWMHDNSVDMGIGEKSLTLDYMKIDTQEKAYKILAVIIAVPVIVAGLGVFVWLRRKNS